MISIQVLATPMMGRARSSSVKPTAFSMARAGARPGPTKSSRLLNFDSFMNPLSGCSTCLRSTRGSSPRQGYPGFIRLVLIFFLFLFLVLLRFRIDDGPGSGVNVNFSDAAVRAEDLHFPDGLSVLLFEFGFHHGAGDLLYRGLDGLLDRHLRILREIGNLAFLVVAPCGAGEQQHQADCDGGCKSMDAH